MLAICLIKTIENLCLIYFQTSKTTYKKGNLLMLNCKQLIKIQIIILKVLTNYCPKVIVNVVTKIQANH